LKKCRHDAVVYRQVKIDGEKCLQGVCGRVLDLTVTVQPTGELYHAFRLHIASGEKFTTVILYRPEHNTILVDRSNSGFIPEHRKIREFPVRDQGGELKLRILLDRCSMELFVNDGEQAATFTLYTPQAATGISFSADGRLLIDVEQYRLGL